jgi:hypothetical protein
MLHIHFISYLLRQLLQNVIWSLGVSQYMKLGKLTCTKQEPDGTFSMMGTGRRGTMRN